MLTLYEPVLVSDGVSMARRLPYWRMKGG